MAVKGIFGYIIGRKKRFMWVDDDAELFWRILVREIYVIFKHYNLSKDQVLKAFEGIKAVKGLPKPCDIKKCKRFTDLSSPQNNWPNLLRFCQSSFINILESGYIHLQEDVERIEEYKFIFDLNKWEVCFYEKDKLLERATIDEIMHFDDMPQKTYIEIVGEMNEKYYDYNDKVIQVESELVKLYRLKTEANNQGAANIEEKVDKLIDDMQWELKELHMSRRVFYHRLKALDLIYLS
jgi:hypothetical protein